MSGEKSVLKTIILCEGYHDRAFWSGYLMHRHFKDQRGTKARQETREPGQYDYLSPKGGHAISVYPCRGKDNIKNALTVKLAGLATDPKDQIIVSVDHDGDSLPIGCEPDWTLGNLCHDLNASKDKNGEAKAIETKDGAPPHISYSSKDGQSTLIYLIQWSAGESSIDYIHVQTLERMVCAAFKLAYANREPPVLNFMESRGDGAPEADGKAYACAHLAGWYGQSASLENLCREIWRDESMSKALLEVLQQANILPILEAIIH